jgi:cell division protein FtsA
LGKTKVEAAKSPMYATTIGLVMAGFRALDDRDTKYQTQINNNTATTKTKSKTKQASGGDFFRKIIERTKGLLIDDFDDKKNNY